MRHESLYVYVYREKEMEFWEKLTSPKLGGEEAKWNCEREAKPKQFHGFKALEVVTY